MNRQTGQESSQLSFRQEKPDYNSMVLNGLTFRRKIVNFSKKYTAAAFLWATYCVNAGHKSKTSKSKSNITYSHGITLTGYTVADVMTQPHYVSSFYFSS